MKKSSIKNILSLIVAAIALVAVFTVFAAWTFCAFPSAKAEIAGNDCEFDDRFADDKIVVVMNDNADNIINYSVDDFSETECLAVTDLTQALKDMMFNGDDKAEKSGVFVRENFRSILRLTLKNKGEQNVSSAVRNLKKRSDIISVQPDRVMELQSAPNDTYYASGEQWALNGENGIHADEAWTITTGSPDVKVGVIDSGVDASHPDLTNRVNRDLWVDYSIYDKPNYDINSGEPFVDLMPDGHGTHVAGIIGAQGDNNAGITGLNWGVDLISLKVSHANINENFYGSQLISAISYAIANGIKVLNNSNFCEDYRYGDYKSCIESLDWMLFNYGGLFVTAAGNSGKNVNNYPYYFPAGAVDADTMIVVGALNKNGNIWDHSNYGNKVDIYAPGADIISTIPVNNEQAGYKSMSGTSGCAACDGRCRTHAFGKFAFDGQGYEKDYFE